MMRSLLIYECIIYHLEIERVLRNRLSLRENIYTFRFHAILLSDEVHKLSADIPTKQQRDQPLLCLHSKIIEVKSNGR